MTAIAGHMIVYQFIRCLAVTLSLSLSNMYHSLTHSLPHSLTHSLTHSPLSLSLSLSLALSRSLSLSLALSRSLALSLSLSPSSPLSLSAQHISVPGVSHNRITKMNFVPKSYSPHMDQPKDPLQIESSDSEEAEHDAGVAADLQEERCWLHPQAQVHAIALLFHCVLKRMQVWA